MRLPARLAGGGGLAGGRGELSRPRPAVHLERRPKLTHRDFLGSILGLGLDREKVGDLLVGDGRLATCWRWRRSPTFWCSTWSRRGV
ncbi:MAG: YlmH/Sll1252 family protein [Flavonifractor plautii]